MTTADVTAAPSKEPTAGMILLMGLIVLVAAGKPILFDTMDPDCFWHLRVAEQLRSDGIGPLVDRLSFASLHQPWTPYSWLAELGMDGVWRLGGWRAAVVVHAILQAAFIIFIALACRAKPVGASPDPGEEMIHPFITDPVVPGPVASAVATAAAAFLSLSYMSFRPVTAALVLLAMCVWLIVRDRRSGEHTAGVWWVIPSTVVLVNLHLYAVFVPMWFAALWVGALLERRGANPEDRAEAERRVTRYGWLLLGTAIACLMTPMLPGVIATAFHYQNADPMVASGLIAEMRPFYSGGSGKISAVLVGLITIFALRNRRHVRIGEWLWLAVAMVLLFRLGRFAAIYGIVAAPMFARALPLRSSRILTRKPVCVMMAIVLIAGFARLGVQFPRSSAKLESWLNRHGPETPGYPCAAADFVAAKVPAKTGRLINEFTWGGYLEWRLGDRYQTLLDGRTQLFSSDFWRVTYLGDADTRVGYLSGIHADAAVLPIKRSVFQEALVKQGWTVAYRDERAQVLLPPKTRSDENRPQWPFANVFFGE